MLLTSSTQYSTAIVSTLCICSIWKVEIHADIFSWRLAVVKRTVRMNDVATVVGEIDISDPCVRVNSLS